MKSTASIEVIERREFKIKNPSLGKVLFNAFFWILLVILESYLWIFKTADLVQWVKDLTEVWIGMGIGIVVVIGLYTYCFLKKYVVRLEKSKIPTMGSMLSILVTIIRVCELIMVVSHFNQFVSLWADGVLPFILFAWIIGASVMGFVRANFIHEHRRARAAHSRNRESTYRRAL